jgi:sporulation protein YlmC with PRC-barrel domain
MLSKAKTLTGYSLQSLDGEIGKVKDFYFDDHYWMIRYLVADTGEWLIGRQVLISPHSLAGAYGSEGTIAVQLTKDQIEHGPSLNRDKPVSRQFEQEYSVFFGSPMYWGFPHEPGAHAQSGEPGKKHADPDLRSIHDVSGHHVEASDGEIGHVEDFLIDDETWAIRYLIVDTKDWLPGKRVLISPKWIERVSWSEKQVVVDLTREAIEQAPEYADDSPLTRDQETALHRHYDRPGYWQADAGGVDDFKLSRAIPGRGPF